ncbi:MAG: hypothetical protein ACRDXX_15480, partial [Stackebrandtia sp.]
GMAAGLALAGLAGRGAAGQAAVVAGLCLLGLGLAVVVPVVFTSAADGPGIATVSSGGIFGWLLGPAVIGGVGEWQGLGAAMWLIPALTVVAGAVAPLGIRTLRRAEAQRAPA